MKKIRINVKNKDYILELNRTAIKWLETTGFSMEEFDKKPVTYYDMLWCAMFIKNHPDITVVQALELLEEYEKEYDVPSIIKVAIEDYQSFISALADTKSKKKPEIIEA